MGHSRQYLGNGRVSTVGVKVACGISCVLVWVGAIIFSVDWTGIEVTVSVWILRTGEDMLVLGAAVAVRVGDFIEGATVLTGRQAETSPRVSRITAR